MNSQNILLSSKDPLGALEQYLVSGFVKPIEQFLAEQDMWVAKLKGSDRSRYEAIVANMRPLQVLEAAHGIGAAIDLDHPFTGKILALNRRRKFLSDAVLENASRYHATCRRKIGQRD